MPKAKANVAITAANFGSVLSHLITADNTMASRIQDLILFGLFHYAVDPTAKGGAGHNDSEYLTRLMNAGFRSVRTEAIKLYIEAHTNLTLRKDPRDETKVIFKIDPNSSNARYTEPTKTWSEWSAVGQAMPLDIDKALPAFVNRFRKALNGDGKKKLAEGTEEHTVSVLAQLEAIVRSLPAKAA